MDEIALTVNSSRRYIKVKRSLTPSWSPPHLIYLICIGLPDVLMAEVLLMFVRFVPAIPTPVSDYAIARNVLMSANCFFRRWCPCSV